LVKAIIARNAKFHILIEIAERGQQVDIRGFGAQKLNQAAQPLDGLLGSSMDAGQKDADHTRPHRTRRMDLLARMSARGMGQGAPITIMDKTADIHPNKAQRTTL